MVAQTPGASSARHDPRAQVPAIASVAAVRELFAHRTTRQRREKVASVHAGRGRADLRLIRSMHAVTRGRAGRRKKGCAKKGTTEQKMFRSRAVVRRMSNTQGRFAAPRPVARPARATSKANRMGDCNGYGWEESLVGAGLVRLGGGEYLPRKLSIVATHGRMAAAAAAKGRSDHPDGCHR
uniref:Uncharacterized protein n=1 Tax=Plectus sambesii TaxID=2011161 RepID=A0A914WLH8_9BILA